MPGFDGTGPLGQGPMTGRGLGFCNPRPGYNNMYTLGPWGNPYRGLGRGLGPGGGRFFGRGRGRFLAGITTWPGFTLGPPWR